MQLWRKRLSEPSTPLGYTALGLDGETFRVGPLEKPPPPRGFRRAWWRVAVLRRLRGSGAEGAMRGWPAWLGARLVRAGAPGG